MEPIFLHHVMTANAANQRTTMLDGVVDAETHFGFTSDFQARHASIGRTEFARAHHSFCSAGVNALNHL